jgi:hypothetical protein
MERAKDAGRGPRFGGAFECLHLSVQRHGRRVAGTSLDGVDGPRSRHRSA